MARPAIQPGADIVGQRPSMLANVRLTGSKSIRGFRGGTPGGRVIGSHATPARRSAGPRRPSLRASVRRNTGSARLTADFKAEALGEQSRQHGLQLGRRRVGARGLRLDREASVRDPLRAANRPRFVQAVRIANKFAQRDVRRRDAPARQDADAWKRTRCATGSHRGDLETSVLRGRPR